MKPIDFTLLYRLNTRQLVRKGGSFEPLEPPLYPLL